jgi:hypothetical protein
MLSHHTLLQAPVRPILAGVSVSADTVEIWSTTPVLDLRLGRNLVFAG